MSEARDFRCCAQTPDALVDHVPVKIVVWKPASQPCENYLIKARQRTGFHFRDRWISPTSCSHGRPQRTIGGLFQSLRQKKTDFELDCRLRVTCVPWQEAERVDALL